MIDGRHRIHGAAVMALNEQMGDLHIPRRIPQCPTFCILSDQGGESVLRTVRPSRNSPNVGHAFHPPKASFPRFLALFVIAPAATWAAHCRWDATYHNNRNCNRRGPWL